MNYKKLPVFSFFSTICLILLFSAKGFTQQANSSNNFEEIYSHWFNAIDKFEANNSIKAKDFVVFNNFSEKRMDSLRGSFMQAIGNGTVTMENVTNYENVLATKIATIYKSFKLIEQRYPSSVDEFRHIESPMLNEVCDSACTNINFESGNLSGWYAYYGVNNASTNNFSIALLTGGLAGAVVHAANDTLTSSAGYYNSISVGPNPRPDYQVNITSGNLHDALVPSLPEVSPFGGHYSVMLGDSTQVNYGVAVLSQKFKVGVSNANFTYQYAVVLANPGHPYYQQPVFKVAILDGANDTIPYCGKYVVVSGHGTNGFDSLEYHDTYPLSSTDTATFWVYYKNWTIVNVPLTHYIGQCVTVIFEAVDCALGGHFGYAYVDASCSPLDITTSSQNFCGQDSITLTGPAGEGHYYWTGPSNGIISNDTLQQISVDSAGTYTLVITPFTGASCKDTLHVTIGKVAGPPPHPSFKADTGCAGSLIQFTNTSTPISGAKFYWDFYNTGMYDDSTVNPSWNYNLPGTYSVKLEEIYNGCGMDTTIKVVIDPVVSSSFVYDTVCYGDTTRFTNTSTGGVTYYWNFGDPSSGVNNSSTLTNPGHHFTAPGTYTVSLIGKHALWCNDSAKEQVVVLALPIPTISGTDSVCAGANTILTVGGGGTYKWSTGATTSTITVSPTADSTFTVTISNGKCSIDTTFKVNVRPVLTGTVTGNNVCFGDTIQLSATGGGTYIWNTGATTSSISIAANSPKDTAYSVTIRNGSSCINLTKDIVIYTLPSSNVCCDSTIFSGSSVVLSGSGGSSYYWIPSTGVSCDTCPNPKVSPTVTTTYTLITTSPNGCTAESSVTITVEIPCKDLFIPNVFTPNGDGVNNTFLINVEFYSTYSISIYNRWGKQVFTSTNPDNPWDGNISGSPASTGVYYYIVRVVCVNGNTTEQHGFLHLIR